VDELSEALRSGDPESRPILLDVREEKEFAVSHLPGAIRVAPDSDVASLAALEAVGKDAAIVAYCSVGYRSSRLVAALYAEGFTNARNLEGSIFEWANRGLPLERDGVRVEEVHPFDEDWGRYLKQELWAHEPRSTGTRGE
jgi:rhodanese-related sulfurtransferase